MINQAFYIYFLQILW